MQEPISQESGLERALTGTWPRYRWLFQRPLLAGFALFAVVVAIVMLAPAAGSRFLYGDF